MLSQRVKDIDSGVLKAGEDFIVQVDKNWYGLFSTTEKTIIEKPKNEATISVQKENNVAKQSPLPSNSSNTITSEKKSQMMDTARKTGKYDIDFLESIQNSYVLEAPQKEVMREYSKYLDNPRTYEAPPETRPSTVNSTKENNVAKQSPLSSNSSSTTESTRRADKNDLMETARKTGKYDIDFLESIQNSYVLEGSKKERLREYSKYLDNPRAYEAPPETRPSTKNKTRTDKLASRAKAMQGQYTQAEIAEKLGISPSYVSSLLS
jgi:hypothetical protein